MPEPSDNWLTVGGWVGGFVGAVITGFVAFYSKERAKAKSDIERSPEVAASAVGAAFVDRSAAQAIVGMADTLDSIASDVGALLGLARERSEQDHDDRLKQTILEEVRRRADRE